MTCRLLLTIDLNGKIKVVTIDFNGKMEVVGSRVIDTELDISVGFLNGQSPAHKHRGTEKL